MRRTLRMMAGTLLSAALLVVGGVGPAQAINVRYRAMKPCTVDGKQFKAHILTYGKPLPEDAPNGTEVQLWGYTFEKGADPTYVEARVVVWVDGAWHDAGSGPGWVGSPVADGEWHRGGNQGGGGEYIGYLTHPVRPTAIMVRGYTYGGPGNEHFCRVFLRPYDLEWIG